jgi:hypothetical protein
MAWQLGSIRLYVQKSSENNSQILPRLQPLSGGTIIQSFGYDSPIRSITALVVGDTNNNSLKAFASDSGTAHELVSPEGSLGNFIVKSYNPNRTDSVCQTIDTLQPEEAPVYDVEIELYES